MDSRDRVLAALDRRPTDRMPADFSAHGPVAQALIARLGLRDHEELLQALGVDLRRVGIDYCQPAEPVGDGYERDCWGRLHLRDPAAAGPDRPAWVLPFSDSTTVDEVHAHRWPDPDRLDYRAVRPQLERLHDRFVTFGGPWCPFFHEVGWLIGQETYFDWMFTRPVVVEAITAHLVDYEVKVLDRFLTAAGGLLDIVYVGNDYGTQRGLFVGPAEWSRFIRPYQRRYFHMAQDHGCRMMFHSCGAVRDLIPWLLEDGVDILDPVQVACASMRLEDLVTDWGGRLAFHGGMDTQHLLPTARPEAVRERVRSYRNLTRDRAGYILAGSQDYMDDIPLDNLLAIYDENLNETGRSLFQAARA